MIKLKQLLTEKTVRLSTMKDANFEPGQFVQLMGKKGMVKLDKKSVHSLAKIIRQLSGKKGMGWSFTMGEGKLTEMDEPFWSVTTDKMKKPISVRGKNKKDVEKTVRSMAPPGAIKWVKVVKEGFAGGFSKDNEEFEDNRKKQAEVLGYTLTGKEDIKVEIGKLTEFIKKMVKEIIFEGMNSSQAKELLQQLGGNKFKAMTGAKDFGIGSDGLHFKIGRNAKSISHIVIDYDRGKDLYNMKFLRVRAGKIKVVKKVKGVYNDMLGNVFKMHTGMNVRL